MDGHLCINVETHKWSAMMGFTLDGRAALWDFPLALPLENTLGQPCPKLQSAVHVHEELG